MDRYFLGAFGNGRFIKPQYEIVEDSLVNIDDRFREFPNGGTVYLYLSEKENVDEIRNKIIKFKLDFEKNISPTFNNVDASSNKYEASLYNILELDANEIIEIISIDCTLDQLINDKSKRKFKLNHKPNRKVLVKIGEFCYGPFECVALNDDQYFNVTIVIEDEKIKKYDYIDIQGYVYDGTFSINSRDSLHFIFNEQKLDLVRPISEIEYIDNDKLIEFIKQTFSQTNDIDNTANLLEKVVSILDNFSNTDVVKMNKSKVRKIQQIIQKAEELKDYKIKISEEYFKHSPDAIEEKRKYIEEHEEILENIAKRDVHYSEKCELYNKKIDELNKEKEKLEEEIKEEERQLKNQQESIKNIQQKVIEDKKQELDRIENTRKQKLQEIEQKRKEAEESYRQFDAVKHTLEDDVKKMRAERDCIKDDINKKIVEWAAENRNSEIVNILFSELSTKENTNPIAVTNNNNIKLIESAEEICNIIQEKLNDSGRNVKKDDVYNYIISIVQNYITVFAGEPGTGKTSLCKLLAKAFGLYDDRFAQISVERGWTSSKDLIGYYNPLTKEIEKTQPGFSKCMETLTKENDNKLVMAPYFVLLDEANLSQIEFYWSNFNYFCDDNKKQIIEYTNGKQYKFGNELKFLATINYDHTTEVLSPRFLDRAWVILMQSVTVDNVLSVIKDDSEVQNNDMVISLDSLSKFFDWNNYKEKKLNPVTRERLNIILERFKSMGHVLSARSIKAIVHFYITAEVYMSSKEIALDYAVAQKMLPLIDGNDKEYGAYLQELLSIFKNNQLERSADIVQRIINKSEHNFYNFFSL